jgi:hypothetical protein
MRDLARSAGPERQANTASRAASGHWFQSKSMRTARAHRRPQSGKPTLVPELRSPQTAGREWNNFDHLDRALVKAHETDSI